MPRKTPAVRVHFSAQALAEGVALRRAGAPQPVLPRVGGPRRQSSRRFSRRERAACEGRFLRRHLPPVTRRPLPSLRRASDARVTGLRGSGTWGRAEGRLLLRLVVGRLPPAPNGSTEVARQSSLRCLWRVCVNGRAPSGGKGGGAREGGLMEGSTTWSSAMTSMKSCTDDERRERGCNGCNGCTGVLAPAAGGKRARGGGAGSRRGAAMVSERSVDGVLL